MRALSLLTFASLATHLFVAPASGAPKNEPSADKPNIVFILADDLGWGELGCYGQEKIRTPNIDKLAQQGIRFTQSYSAAPVCAPARACLMTGLHLGHSPIRGNMQAKKIDPQYTEGQTPLPARYPLLPELFKQAGYATGAFGKWGLGPVGSEGDPTKRGFDRFFGYNCQAAAHTYYPNFLWDNDKKVIINKKPVASHPKRTPPDQAVDMSRYQGKQHSSPLVIGEALKFIEQQAKAQKPFFLFLPFIEPHVALMPEERFLEQYPKDWDTVQYRGESGYSPHPRPRAAYAAMITQLDDHVGRVLDALEKNGLAKNTLVVFTSDNGPTHPVGNRWSAGGADTTFFNSAGGLRGFKGSVFEGGLRIPAIMRWPGKIAPGTTADFPTYFPDYLPTLCAAANIKNSVSGDGINFLPIMTGDKNHTVTRNPMVWVFPEYQGQVAVRLGDFKILRRNLATKKKGPWLVYNVVKDPQEKENLADKHPELIKQAVEILRKESTPNTLFPLEIPGVE